MQLKAAGHAREWWTTCGINMDLHTAPGEYLTSSHFVMASQKRLGTISVRGGFFFQLTEAVHSANPGKCGEILDKRLIHPCAAYNKGPVKNSQHDYLEVSMGDSLADAKAHVDYERVAPDLF